MITPKAGAGAAQKLAVQTAEVCETLKFPPKFLAERAGAIKMLALDVDGVLTDGSLYIGAEGEVCKAFNAKDGMGLTCAQRVGLKVVIITGRQSSCVAYRAKELGITEVCFGVRDKKTAILALAGKYGIALQEIAFVGDDLNDLPALVEVGLACAPFDAVEEVQAVAHYVAEARGGQGAVREVIEVILKAKGLWEQLVASYLIKGQGDKQ